MKNFIIFLITCSTTLVFGQDYLLQDYISGGNDAIYGKRNMAADNNGNIYATGVYNDSFNIQNSVVTDDGIYLAKFTNDLSLIWLKKVAKIMGGDAGGGLTGLRLMIALDSVDNVIIGYSAWGGSYLMYDDSIDVQTNNVELIKLDSFGTRLWRTSVTKSNRLGDKGIAVDGQNNILVTGKDSNDDVFLAKYDETGNEVWYNTAGVIGTDKIDEGTAVITDSDNNIYIAGQLYQYASSDTAFFGSEQIVFPISCFSPTYLAKYSTDGNLQWVRYMYSSSNTINNAYGSSTITSLECFEDGSIAVGGFFTNQQLMFSDGYSPMDKNGGAPGLRAAFLSRFDTNGNRLWAKVLHNTTNAGTHLVDLSIDNTSSIYLLNEYWGTVVNELGDTIPVNGGTSNDILLERYNLNGNLISSIGIGSKSHDFAYDIITYGNSVFTYSASGSQGNTPFYIGTDSILFSNEYLNSMVLLKLTENPSLSVVENTLEYSIELFPNPNNGIFTVLIPKENYEINIHNISGEIIYKTAIQNTEQFNIDIQGFPSGIYILNLKSDNITYTKKMIID